MISPRVLFVAGTGRGLVHSLTSVILVSGMQSLPLRQAIRFFNKGFIYPCGEDRVNREENQREDSAMHGLAPRMATASRAGAGTRRGVPRAGVGIHALEPSSALPDRKQRAGAEMEQLGLEPAPMRDAAAQGGDSVHYTTALAGGHGPVTKMGSCPLLSSVFLQWVRVRLHAEMPVGWSLRCAFHAHFV